MRSPYRHHARRGEIVKRSASKTLKIRGKKNKNIEIASNVSAFRIRPLLPRVQSPPPLLKTIQWEWRKRRFPVSFRAFSPCTVCVTRAANKEMKRNTSSPIPGVPGSKSVVIADDDTLTSNGVDSNRKPQSFIRNLYLPLCAPNYVTARAYRKLLKVRRKTFFFIRWSCALSTWQWTIVVRSIAKSESLP